MSYRETNRPLNSLVIMTDQHRIDTLGCYGNPNGTSPALDALAAEGTVFDNAFTPTAICTPARATLLTGKLPFRHGLLANFERNVGYREELEGETSYAELLRAAGHNCGLIGKWHIGRERGPEDFGFEGTHFPGWGNSVRHPEYLEWLSQHHYPAHRRSSEVRGRFPNGEPGNLLAGVLEQPAEATFEHFLATKAIDQLARYARDWRSHRRPFHIACNFFGPHLPYLLPVEDYFRYEARLVQLPKSMEESFADKPVVQRHYSEHWSCDQFGSEEWQRLIATYWGYVSLIDREVARIIECAMDLGLWDDLAVLFTADHGEFTGAHRLHDKGPAMYDDIYRIPLILRVPGAPPRRVSDFVTLTDVTPTLLELGCVSAHADMDGASLLPHVGGQETSREDALIAEFHGHHFPYPQRMLRTRQWKLVINPAGVNELYNLVDDPDELVNRYRRPDHRSVRVELERGLYQRLVDRGDNFYHWMSSMNDVGEKAYDVSLSEVDS